MPRLQALIQQAGGAVAFNAIAAEVLTRPAPAAEEYNEFDDLAALDSLTEAIQSSFSYFLHAPANDDSEIAAALALRPYGRRLIEGVPTWWRRQVAAPGWIDCLHADILDLHLEWLHRFRRFHSRIHRRPMGPNTLSAAGRTVLAARQALFEQIANARQAHLQLSQQADDSDDDTLSDVSQEHGTDSANTHA